LLLLQTPRWVAQKQRIVTVNRYKSGAGDTRLTGEILDFVRAGK
jgi:hypothetical protein